MPAVSVIIPVYGVERYIERCARSLFEQTLKDIEYLFIDDCTPDRSIEILKRVLEDYPHRKSQVTIHHMGKNSGQARVREWGMKNATGEYVIHCDSDDWIDIPMYEDLYNRAIADNAEMVVCGYKTTNGTIVYNTHIPSVQDVPSFIEKMLLMKESWAVWNKLVKRECYSHIKYPQFSMGEDMTIIFQITVDIKHISFVQKAYYNYLYNETSITRAKDECKRFCNWNESVANANIVIDVFASAKLTKRYFKQLEYIKYKQLKMAGNLAEKRQYAKRWLITYPEIHYSLLMSKYLTMFEKVKFYTRWAYAKILTLL